MKGSEDHCARVGSDIKVEHQTQWYLTKAQEFSIWCKGQRGMLDCGTRRAVEARKGRGAEGEHAAEKEQGTLKGNFCRFHVQEEEREVIYRLVHVGKESKTYLRSLCMDIPWRSNIKNVLHTKNV